MDLLRASSNFLNIHGAWVLGGLIAAGLIKTKSNQKKQRAEWEESEVEVKIPSSKCQSCGYVMHSDEMIQMESRHGLNACPQCESDFWVLSTIDTIMDPTLQLWVDPGDSFYGASLDAALHKVGHSIDNFPEGVEIEIGSAHEELLYADPDDYDSEIIGFADPVKVKLFTVPGDMFDSWEYTDGETILRFGNEGERINFLILEHMTGSTPPDTKYLHLGQCVVKIGGDAPEIEIEYDGRFVKIDGHQYDIIEDDEGYYAEDDDTTPTPKNPCPRCEGSAGFPKEFYFHPKRLDFIPCRNCIEMGGNCPGCMEVLPGLTRDRDPWEAFDEGCGKCGWSWADATAIRSTTTPWNVHLDHPGAQRWFASEDDAYAYAYTEGHRDSRIGSPYKPLLKKVNRDSFRKVVRQNAEGGGFDAEKIGSRPKRKHYLTVADLKKALKNAKDTDRIAAGDLHDENRIYTPMKRIYRDRIENNDYLIIVSDDGMGGLYWDKDTEDLWNAEDEDPCELCGEVIDFCTCLRCEWCGDLRKETDAPSCNCIPEDTEDKDYGSLIINLDGGWSIGNPDDILILQLKGKEGKWVSMSDSQFIEDNLGEIRAGLQEGNLGDWIAELVRGGYRRYGDDWFDCSVCDGLGWRYVEDDDGESVRAPCYECGGGSSTGSPTGVVAYDADNYDRATHGPYLPVGAVKRFLTRMPPRQEFYVSFVKANNTVRDMECILTNPYNPDNDVAGVMELGGSRAAFKRFRTDRVISIYR